MLAVTNSASELAKHRLSERHLAEGKCVAEPDVDAEDEQINAVVHHVLNHLVDFAAKL